jgi:hypothetical protein
MQASSGIEMPPNPPFQHRRAVSGAQVNGTLEGSEPGALTYTHAEYTLSPTTTTVFDTTNGDS